MARVAWALTLDVRVRWHKANDAQLPGALGARERRCRDLEHCVLAEVVVNTSLTGESVITQNLN
jgi:hypothetical protein